MNHLLRAGSIAALSLVCTASAFAAPADPPTPLPRPYGRGQVSYHKTAFAPYRFANSIIRVSFDFPKGIVYGDETALVYPKHDGLTQLPFNTLGITYTSVHVDGRPVSYHVDAAKQQILVDLPSPARASQELAVEFRYSAQPQRGLYFIRPDKGYPKVTPEIWSQGEMIDNRRWFPTWDEPNEKTPSELVITVPRGWTAVGNGSLKAHTQTATSDTWDWNAPRPKSTYLIAFATGPLSENHQSLGSLAVDSYVPEQYASLNALCFARTKNIVAHFQNLIGINYPWEKEDQVAAERFTYGGMENASVTIQTDGALHPSSEEATSPCDGLIAHELAHQWWGDDVTMSDWSNTWINEGYATYFQELWSEKRFGEAAFENERYGAQQTYFRETMRYYRPIVDYVYNDPLDLFDASGYQRPGQVLHMLRYMFGDKRFFGALHAYLTQYSYKNADTHQFFTSIEKSLGTDLGWFENEWFYRAAYPDYTVTQQYDASAQRLTLDVTQNNHDGKPFRMPVAIEAYFDGQMKRVQPTIDQNHQVVTIDGVTSAPQMVLFDPNNNVLRRLTFRKSVTDLAYQATHAQHVSDRLWALTQLARARRDRAGALTAIAQVATGDSFYAVRSAAIAAAARLGDAETVHDGMHDKDVRVRLAAIGAAGALRHTDDDGLIADLKDFTHNTNPLVVAAALRSLGALKAPGAYAMLVAALREPSFRGTIASGAIGGLAAYDDMRAFPLVKSLTAYGVPENERDSAIGAMESLASDAKQPELVEAYLLDLAQHDPLIRTRGAAVGALGDLGDPRAIPALERVEADDSQQAVQSGAWQAILSIKDAIAMRNYMAHSHGSASGSTQQMR